MKIAVASGKRGTGKTTVATNLAQVLAQSGIRVLVGAPAGTPEELVSAYLNGSLKAGQNA